MLGTRPKSQLNFEVGKTIKLKSMKKIKLILLTLVIATTYSCGTSGSVTKTTNEHFEATEVSSIEVFTSTKPTKEYFEIGAISVKRLQSRMMPINRPAEKVLSEMKIKAASIGGNAIINYRESGEMNMTGTVIRYK